MKILIRHSGRLKISRHISFVSICRLFLIHKTFDFNFFNYSNSFNY